MKTEPLQLQWIKHIGAENNERGSNPKDIIENVSFSAAEGMRGDLTGREYDAPAALAMTAKYDKLAAAGYFRKDPHLNKLSATDAIIASSTGNDAARYHKQDPELLKHYYELRAKGKKILNQVAVEKKRKKDLLEKWGLTKKDPDLKPKMRKWIQEADDEKLENLEIFKDNINKKKKIKVASRPKPNGYDTEPNVIPIGPIPHEKPWYEDAPENGDDDAAYKFNFPEKEKYSVLDKIKLQSDLQKAYDNNSGIGRFDTRRRLASGGNGSTSKWDKEHPFTKKIQDIYGIQLTGQETLEELLEIVGRLNDEK
ncbi:MAG: hypothetical protein H8E55_21545 [Pelagibacterales bacterium]|nr:hypothetical protein [Pelagibacterales bacterium]